MSAIAYEVTPKRKCAPPKYEIARHWMEREWRFVVDIGEPSCFACEWYDERWELLPNDTEKHLRRIWENTRGLEICHLVPHALGGSATVDNLVLLCGPCHLAAPDFRVDTYMLKWMLDRESWLSRTMRDLEEATRAAWATFGLDWPSTMAQAEAFTATLEDPTFKQFVMENVVAVPGTTLSDRISTYVAAFCEYRTQAGKQIPLWI